MTPFAETEITRAKIRGFRIWGLLLVWAFATSLIGVGWFIYDGCEDKRFGTFVVGSINFFSGSVCALSLQALHKYPLK